MTISLRCSISKTSPSDKGRVHRPRRHQENNQTNYLFANSSTNKNIMNIRRPGEFSGAFLRAFCNQTLARCALACKPRSPVQTAGKKIKRRKKKKKGNEKLRITSPYVTDLSAARGLTYSSLIGRTGRKYSHKAKNKQRGAEILR